MTKQTSTTNHSNRPTGIGLTIAYILLLLLLVTLPRLTHFWGYLIVDEADRWRWAENFAIALHRGDLVATLVGDGYPGIVPVWAETVWIYAEMTRRSWYAGEWIGMPGLFHLLHQWQRVESLHWQRLPIVILNSLLALAIITAVWRLFGRQVGLLAGILIALDPFYLSDSRVNRAEAIITGLMTLSILSLIFYAQQRRWWWIVISGIFGGLSLLTKIQALVILPAVALILLIEKREPRQERNISYFLVLSSSLSLWIVSAGLIWFLLWPAMWVSPLETLTLVYNYTTRKVGAEGVNLFFWGQTYRDADPGLFFYPVVFMMRLTPVALIGLLGFVIGGGWFLKQAIAKQSPAPLAPLSPLMLKPQFRDSVILLIYILVYVLAMSVGSHKQDRYLLPIFLSVDILAAIGWVYLGHWLRAKLTVRRPVVLSQLAIISLIIIQIGTIYPHHPYYYSYFNPLLGGGPMASQTLRIGWGEGMDQVADYLSAKPNARDLVVSSRFTHNLVDFKGETISLLSDGRWTQADYIVLYIQQVQRYQEPSPGFLDYFLARTPEKVITIGGIDYARIYPVPFNVSANPQISLIPDQLALLGYRWQDGDSSLADESSLPGQWVTMRVLWENLGLAAERNLVTRLVGATTETDWATCQPDPAFERAAQTPGDLVESLCRLDTTLLPTTTYTVEFGLSENPAGTVETISFPEGWLAARLTATGKMTDTSLIERLNLIAQEAIPPTATRLERVYDERLRLTAYHLEPASPQPGDEMTVTLYWQRLAEMLQPLHLTVQLADSRAISLGRQDVTLHVAGWLDGASRPTHHTFRLPADLDTPLAAQVEVSLVNPAKVPLMPTDLAGQPLDKVIGRLTILPATSQPPEFRALSAVWQEGIMLSGYRLSAETVQPGESLTVSLFWQARQSVANNYVVFVHVVADTGQPVAQSDSLPRAGAYPTSWWLPDLTIEDSHQITLPAEVSPGRYSLVVGLYEAETMRRLPLMVGGDSFQLPDLVITE